MKLTELGMTIAEVWGLHPCEEYTDDRLHRLWAGRESLLPSDVVALDIPPQDRIWLLVRWKRLTKHSRVAFTCACARELLPMWQTLYPEDYRPQMALEIAETWLVKPIPEVVSGMWLYGHGAVNAANGTSGNATTIAYGCVHAVSAVLEDSIGAAYDLGLRCMEIAPGFDLFKVLLTIMEEQRQ